MFRASTATPSRLLAFVTLAAAVLIAGCAATTPPPETEPAPPTSQAEPAPPAQEAEPVDAADEIEALQREIEDLEREVRGLETQVGDLQLGLLESEAQQSLLRVELDEAIREAVRSKGKLQSVESRAQAASTIAEAEIALNALPASLEGTPRATQARALLAMSSSEFENENYGGALYLATQAKESVSTSPSRAGGSASRESEVLFALPLPLQVLRTSNVRSGPGTSFEVLFTLDEGTLLSGHAYENQWVRVSLADGRDGWIYSTLVGSRNRDSRR